MTDRAQDYPRTKVSQKLVWIRDWGKVVDKQDYDDPHCSLWEMDDTQRHSKIKKMNS